MGKIIKWKQYAPFANIKLSKGAKIGIIVDKKNIPQGFVFNTKGFIELLSLIDEKLADILPEKHYYSKKTNPAGWLIDKIEEQLPIDKKFEESLEKLLEEAEKEDWLPLKKA